MATLISENAKLDDAIVILNQHKDEWARLPIAHKIAHLKTLKDRLMSLAPRWVERSAKGKGLPPDSPLVGEEWMGGPWAFLHNIKGFIESLEAFQQGKTRKPNNLRTRANGQVVAEVFPLNYLDKLVLSGYHAEVWMQPEVTLDNFYQNMGAFYKDRNPVGKLALVLGAGNINSIPSMDTIYRLFAEGQVVLLKMNPVNDYLGPILEEIFGDMVKAGYVQFAYGGPEVGQYLTAHEDIDEIHITGSAQTHDAIVFGAGEEGKAHKARNEPILKKRITSELGAVCPVIVVPGQWDDLAIRHQAENIATMKMHNGGFNCVAVQVIVLAENWPQKDQLLNAIRDVLKKTEKRKAYYPGADKRQQAAVATHPHAEILDNRDVPTTLITNINPNSDDMCFRDEAFGGVLSVTELPGNTPEEFLKNAVRFSNEKLWGTLGANIIAHPKTIKDLGPALDTAIDDLHYGAVAVNAWTGACYLISQCSWGAYPGHTYDNIQSGIGVVHNSFMFDKPQKSVAYGPFYPYPHNFMRGEWHLSPKPAWFVTNKQQLTIGRRFTYYEANQGIQHLPGLFLAALRG